MIHPPSDRRSLALRWAATIVLTGSVALTGVAGGHAAAATPQPGTPVATALTQSPGSETAGDPRSSGQAATIGGQPLLAAASVVLLGVATAVVTVMIVRFSKRT